ncbi:MAG: hypothetical protein JXB24_00560 [Bacteroidales bacterium]|nr:hypothetical protein [Bacteroidales bacterium]
MNMQCLCGAYKIVPLKDLSRCAILNLCLLPIAMPASRFTKLWMAGWPWVELFLPVRQNKTIRKAESLQ